MHWFLKECGVCWSRSLMSEFADAVTSGAKAAELIGERDYDIYVLDVNLPDISGFDLVDMIREIDESSARIIISTMHEEIWIINRLNSPESECCDPLNHPKR